MNFSNTTESGGIVVQCRRPDEASAVEALLATHGLTGRTVSTRKADTAATYLHLRLTEAALQEWVPNYDTTRLRELMGLDVCHDIAHLEREILVALLASPVLLSVPSRDELLATIHIRRNIVQAGYRTALDFYTSKADRPRDCWRLDEDRGFVVLPGIPLIDALVKATQPACGGKLYAFSCYRATEYVIMLGIAQELANCNPPLLELLQQQCETRIIRSGQFHDVFLHEYGSQDQPLPTHYYVPGDRLWFRNPDEASSDITGYEGSWVVYLGGGLFTNFWKRDQPYTLSAKCLEIYHWRNGTFRNSAGELTMDEAVVEQRVAATLADPAKTASILQQMMRWREPQGCYGNGGCIDTTREAPRWVCPGTGNLVLPLI